MNALAYPLSLYIILELVKAAALGTCGFLGLLRREHGND